MVLACWEVKIVLPLPRAILTHPLFLPLIVLLRSKTNPVVLGSFFRADFACRHLLRALMGASSATSDYKAMPAMRSHM